MCKQKDTQTGYILQSSIALLKQLSLDPIAAITSVKHLFKPRNYLPTSQQILLLSLPHIKPLTHHLRMAPTHTTHRRSPLQQQLERKGTPTRTRKLLQHQKTVEQLPLRQLCSTRPSIAQAQRITAVARMQENCTSKGFCCADIRARSPHVLSNQIILFLTVNEASLSPTVMKGTTQSNPLQEKFYSTLALQAGGCTAKRLRKIAIIG